MKILHIVIIAICLVQLSSKLHAESTSDEKNFIVGRALSFAYALDAVSDICNGSTNSRDKFNTLKNLVRDRLKTDLYKVEKDVNMEFGNNVRDNLKIGLREHVSELGGCGSKNYYEWLVKAQKDFGESLVVIANMQ